MLVKTLIKQLKECDPDARIVVKKFDENVSTPFLQKDNNLWGLLFIVPMDDIDWRGEIRTQFKHAQDTNMDKADLFTQLFEIGFSGDMVSDVMGKEIGHEMTQYILSNKCRLYNNAEE